MTAPLEEIERIVREHYGSGPDAICRQLFAALYRPTDFNRQCARAVLEFRRRRAEGLPDDDNYAAAKIEFPDDVSPSRMRLMVGGKVRPVTDAIKWLQAHEPAARL